jgi:acyl-CoA thioester hydrolase
MRAGATIGATMNDPTLPWDLPRPFTLRVVPSAGDIDGLDHTNNAVYVQWCEQVAWGHSESLGLSLADYRRLDRAMAIRRAEYDYLLPTQRGEPLVIGTWLAASDGRLTMERRFQVLRLADRATVLRGRWHLVCIDISSGRVRRLPDEFCRVYLQAIAPSAAASG